MKLDSVHFNTFSFDHSEEIDLETLEIENVDHLMLGKQAEYLFEYYLNQSSRYNLLAANIQIQGDEQTLGELDYIIYDKLNLLNIHVELACKFYLFDPSILSTQNAKWIGPNRKDTLVEKLKKIEQKQFPLLHREITVSRLIELGIDAKSISQQLCLKAFLFVPKGHYSLGLLPNYENCIKGYWISFSEFTDEEKSPLYSIPQKKQWLLEPNTIEEWVSHSVAEETIKASIENQISPLVYKKTGPKIELFFVVWW